MNNSFRSNSSGAVNGVPVVFMIDTGATTVSVSTEIASRAGIQKCVSQQTMTANGKVNACKAIVPEVSFGKFKLTNVEVMVMPNMPGNALLLLRNELFMISCIFYIHTEQVLTCKKIHG